MKLKDLLNLVVENIIQIVLLRSVWYIAVDSPDNLAKDLTNDILNANVYSIFIDKIYLDKRKNCLTIAVDL